MNNIKLHVELDISVLNETKVKNILLDEMYKILEKEVVKYKWTEPYDILNHYSDKKSAAVLLSLDEIIATWLGNANAEPCCKIGKFRRFDVYVDSAYQNYIIDIFDKLLPYLKKGTRLKMEIIETVIKKK